MSVMVYSRLGDLLRARNLTVRDLQRQIAARFGLTVDTRTLERLARAERVRRADLEVAAAAAAVLDVGLNDVFAVEAIPVDGDAAGASDNAEDDILDPNQSLRLQELFDLRDRRPLTAEEQAEMQVLVAEYGRRVHKRGVRELAERRNLPQEQVRAEVVADFDRALTWWDEVQADPARLEALVNEARERQRAHTDG